MNKKTLLIIIVLTAIAFLIRFYVNYNGDISFHYDMSRDAFAAEEIWKDHNLKIQGPPTSTPGLFHGVAYYYLLAIFYFIGNGSPYIAAFCMSFFNALAVIPIFLLVKNYFKSTAWALIGSILYSLSFEAIQYSGWLSNPSPAILTVPLYFYGLYLWKEKDKRGLYLAIFSAALSMQFQFFLIYLFLGALVYKFLFKIPLSIKDIVISSGISILVLSSFFVSIIKFNSLNTVLSAINSYSSTEHVFFDNGFTSIFQNYLNHFANIFVYNFVPSSIFLGGILALVCLYLSRKERFIIFGLLLNSCLFIFGGHSSNYANVGIVAPAILSVIFLMKNNGVLLKILIFLFIIYSNISTVIKVMPYGQPELVIPKAMTLKNEIALVEKTYELSESKSFSVNSITLPLWINTNWDYIYHWYGNKKYGYVPTYYGRDQIGQPGEKALQHTSSPLKTSFLIMEPGDGIPSSFYNDEIRYEESRTKLINLYDFNGITLQHRTLLISE